MVCKQLSALEKGQIVACNDCEMSLYDIAKKLNSPHSSFNVFLKIIKKNKVEIIIKKKICKRKNTASEDTNIVREIW